MRGRRLSILTLKGTGLGAPQGLGRIRCQGRSQPSPGPAGREQLGPRSALSLQRPGPGLGRPSSSRASSRCFSLRLLLGALPTCLRAGFSPVDAVAGLQRNPPTGSRSGMVSPVGCGEGESRDKGKYHVQPVHLLGGSTDRPGHQKLGGRPAPRGPLAHPQCFPGTSQAHSPQVHLAGRPCTTPLLPIPSGPVQTLDPEMDRCHLESK